MDGWHKLLADYDVTVSLTRDIDLSTCIDEYQFSRPTASEDKPNETITDFKNVDRQCRSRLTDVSLYMVTWAGTLVHRFPYRKPRLYIFMRFYLKRYAAKFV